MRILHVIASLDPAMGGPPVVASRLAAAQAGIGHEVHLACYHPATGPALPADADVPHWDRVTVHGLPLGGASERLIAGGMKALLRPLIPGMQVIHLHGVWERMLPAAAALARRAAVPYVVAPHGMLDPWSLQQRSLKKRVALALGYRRMLDQAAFLHTLNQDEASLLEPLKLLAPPHVIPNGIFLEEIEPLPAPGSFHAAHPELAGRPFVLFLSRLHYKKGLDYLAEAFAEVALQVPDVRLVVAGPDEGARDLFVQRVAQLKVQDRVHLVGPLYGQAKAQAMVDAACFCLPSRQEGFSVAVLEALACRTAVVISDACHFPEVAAAGAGEIVPLQAPAIAAALRRVLQDGAARQAMGRRGRELVESRYTWPRIAEQATAYYQQVTARVF